MKKRLSMSVPLVFIIFGFLYIVDLTGGVHYFGVTAE